MSRPVPVCHRTIGPEHPFTDGDGHPEPRPCAGSRCALWNDSKLEPGFGLCAETIPALDAGTRARLWPDPAQEGGDS